MAIEIPDQLKEIAAQVKNGCARTETVRTLLSWFGFERRAHFKVRQVRKALNKLKLKTEPDFNEGWIDGSVTFVSKAKAATSADSPGTEVMQATESTEAAQPAAPTSSASPTPSRRFTLRRVKKSGSSMLCYWQCQGEVQADAQRQPFR